MELVKYINIKFNIAVNLVFQFSETNPQNSYEYDYNSRRF